MGRGDHLLKGRAPKSFLVLSMGSGLCVAEGCVLDTHRDGGGIGHILAFLTDFSKPIDPCGGDLIALRAAV